MSVTTLDAFFERYRKAFAAYDAEGLSKLIHLPCLVSSGPDLVAPGSREDLLHRLERQFERHREAQVDKASFVIVQSRRLSPRIAQADLRWTFHNVHGEALPTCGVSYTLFSPEHGWKIATVLPLEL